MRKKIISAIFCLAAVAASGQNTGSSKTLPNIQPPSSESYKLGSYGNIPVSLFTGNANLDIPLTSYQTKNISIPIRLNYSSNGIKVDDMNGYTGLGWSLVSSGVITRIIRDLPDEDHLTNIAFPTNIDSLGAVNNPAVMQFFQDASHENVDTEQDLYMANFNGMQIKFIFDKRGIPVIHSQKDVVIEGTSGGDSFVITTDDGTKYYFADIEQTTNRTSGDGHSLISNKKTAWYLTRIEDSTTGEVVYIENVDDSYSAVVSRSQTLSYTSPTGGPMTSGCGNPAFIRYPMVSELINHNQTVNGKLIKRIYSNNPLYGEIIFDYTPYPESKIYKSLERIVKKLGNTTVNDISLNYIFTGGERLFLTSVNDDVSEISHQFEYISPQEFPPRLSFSRDSWGYYNGISTNTNLVPSIPEVSQWSSYNGAVQTVNPDKTQIGMLKKVIYPTKGFTEFFYENHQKAEKNVMLNPEIKTGVNIGAESLDYGPGHVSNSTTFVSAKDEEIFLGGGSQFNNYVCDPQQEVPDKHRAVARLKRPNGQPVNLYKKTSGGMITDVGSQFTFPNSGDSFYAMVQKDEVMTLSLETLFRCARAEVGATFTQSLAVYGDRQEPIGGLRISKIIDTAETGVASVRKFVYRNLTDQTTEAIVLRTPAFQEQLSYTRTCNGTPNPGNPGGGIPMGVERFPYYMVTSSNINQLFASHPNVFYKTVQEIVEGKSNIVHTYSTDSDDFGKVLYGSNISSSQWTNFGWNNGREILTNYLDSNDNPVRKVEMKYEEDQSRKYQVDGYVIRKNYENPVAQNVTRTCSAQDVTKTIEYIYCTANHSHHYTTMDSFKNCQAPGANNITQQYKDICYGRNVGEVIAFDDYLDNLDIMQYKNISHFEYLKSQKTTDFLEGKELKTETQYYYNNPKHTQLSVKKTVFPDLSSNETNYGYAHEKNNQLMISRNMVGIPMETVVTQTQGGTTKMLSKTETRYPQSLPDPVSGNLVQPVSEKSYDVLNPVIPSTDVTYNKYDDKGNVLQYTTKEGVPVSILWGYIQTRPIAKVEGVAYSEIENTVTWMYNASDADAADPTQESNLLDTYERFRKMGILKDKLVTTYTYDPLIGLTSLTPPSGIREIYAYDTAGRLKEVKVREKDSSGSYVYKTIKQFSYNYRP